MSFYDFKMVTMNLIITYERIKLNQCCWRTLQAKYIHLKFDTVLCVTPYSSIHAIINITVVRMEICEINYFGFSNKLRIFLLKSSALISFFIAIFLQNSISFYYWSFWKINGNIPEIDSMTFEMNRWKIFRALQPFFMR